MTVRTQARRTGRTLRPDAGRRSLRRVALAAFLFTLLAPAAAPAVSAAAGSGAALDGPWPSSFIRSDDIARRGEAPGKDGLHRLQIVANIRAETPPTPLVILIGGSSARESTVDDASWAAEIGSLGGPEVTAYNLGCRHDTFADDLQTVDLLPDGLPAVVYIGINLGRFASPPSSPTLGLPDPLIPPPRYYQHIYSVDKRVQSPSTKAYYVRYWLKKRWPEFKARYGYNLGVLEQVIEKCLERGLHPVLLDLPRDLPVIGRSLDKAVAMEKEGCASLARAYGIPWITPVKGCGLVDGDFFDLWHLVEPGRVKYQAKISQKSVTLLHKYGLDEPPPSPSPTPTQTPSAAGAD